MNLNRLLIELAREIARETDTDAILRLQGRLQVVLEMIDAEAEGGAK